MIVVTGATGFVGTALCSELLRQGFHVVAAVRSVASALPFHHANLRVVVVGDICESTDWREALQGARCVIHCAARAHITDEQGMDALPAFRTVNVDGTRRLAEQAALFGVKRMVYLSSIKVNGEGTLGTQRFSADDLPAPEDAYGVSKLEAEQLLNEWQARTGAELVTVRSPLVYGPGVKGNLARLVGLVAKGWPLPLGAATRNARSLIGLSNLVDFLVICAGAREASGRLFLVSDGEDLSTYQLISMIANFLGVPARMVHIPENALRLLAAMLGRRRDTDRLFGSLAVDSSPARDVLGWVPVKSVEEGIREMVEDYRFHNPVRR